MSISESGFDAELYLRLLGERSLQEREFQRRSGGDPVATAAVALAAAGLISRERAYEISGDYRDAAMLATRDHIHARHDHGSADPPATPRPLAPRRVVGSLAEVQKSDWDLRVIWISLADDGCTLGVTGHTVPGRGRGNNGPPALDVTLPDGRRLTTQFSGGWGSDGINGRFSLADAVPPESAWIQIEGQRISLEASAPSVPVSVETLPDRFSALDYLWQLFADFGSRHLGDAAEPAIAALLAAGVLEDDPELEAIRWFSEHGQQFRHPFGGQPSFGSGLPAGLPDAWRSLLSRRPGSGPRGSQLVGAVTPLFDGISVAVNQLTSHGGGWELDVETVGVPHPHPHGSAFERRPLAWWAFDDRGGHYLGTMNNWSGGGSPEYHGSGGLSFQPLDPKASRLTIAPTATRARALIELELTCD